MAIRFPFTSMQQLNLDWIMEFIKNCLVGVQLPALLSYATFGDTIDVHMNEIPVGPSLLVFGDAGTDPIANCAMAFCFKKDSVNCFVRLWGYPAVSKAGWNAGSGWTYQ